MAAENTPESAADVDDEQAVPDSLRGSTHTAFVLRDRIWSPPNRQNNWCGFVMVGREGSGKSHTTASILEFVDPTFTADRVFFDPIDLIEYINGLSKAERQGKAVMLDEAGVGMGVRSWYEKEQIQTNKALQTLRDDNMIVGLTLPSFSLLDSQTRTRLHGFCEMRDVFPGDHAVWSWKDIVVDRTEKKQEIKRKRFPRRRMDNGRIMKIARCAVAPPSDEFIEEYEGMKATFKTEYMEEVIADDEEEEDVDPRELAQEIIDNDEIEEYTSLHGGWNKHYVDKDRIHLEYDHLTHQEAQTVKKLLAEAWDGGDEQTERGKGTGSQV